MINENDMVNALMANINNFFIHCYSCYPTYVVKYNYMQVKGFDFYLQECRNLFHSNYLTKKSNSVYYRKQNIFSYYRGRNTR